MRAAALLNRANANISESSYPSTDCLNYLAAATRRDFLMPVNARSSSKKD
jgi:hypothetical protein